MYTGQHEPTRPPVTSQHDPTNVGPTCRPSCPEASTQSPSNVGRQCRGSRCRRHTRCKMSGRHVGSLELGSCVQQRRSSRGTFDRQRSRDIEWKKSSYLLVFCLFWHCTIYHVLSLKVDCLASLTVRLRWLNVSVNWLVCIGLYVAQPSDIRQILIFIFKRYVF